MSATRRSGRVLPFQSSDVLARRGAEARLLELLAEAREIESWLSETEVRQQPRATSIARRSSRMVLIKG